MNVCLVTRLKGEVKDASLRKIGEMRFKIHKVDSPTGSTQGFSVYLTENATLYIVGDGYFTDATLTENKGKEISVKAWETTSVYVSNNDVEIGLIKKYSLCKLFFTPTEFTAYNNNKEMSVDELNYSKDLLEISMNNSQLKGDIKSFSDLPYIENIYANNTNVYGDIIALEKSHNIKSIYFQSTSIYGDISSVLKWNNLALFYGSNCELYGDIISFNRMINLKYLSLSNNVKVSGNLSAIKDLKGLLSISLNNTKVSGDLSNLGAFDKLTNLFLYGTNISGNLSSLIDCISLIEISLSHITGDVSSFSKMLNLTSAVLDDGSFVGDLAKVPDNLSYLDVFNSSCSFTWSRRSSSAKIISINGSPRISNIDQMLIDQSACVVPDKVSKKLISATGERTSASDEAVLNLQNKGYTVLINR